MANEQDSAPAQELELLRAQNDALAANAAALEQRLKALESNHIGAKSVTIEADSAPAELPKDLPEFSVSGQKYKFNAPTFYIGTNFHTARDAAKDKTLLAEIVAQYPGILVRL